MKGDPHISLPLCDNKATDTLWSQSPPELCLNSCTLSSLFVWTETNSWNYLCSDVYDNVLTWVPDDPQVAEHGPHSDHGTRSQWLTGHDGRRHLLYLSSLSGHGLPLPWLKVVTLLNRTLCPWPHVVLQETDQGDQDVTTQSWSWFNRIKK